MPSPYLRQVHDSLWPPHDPASRYVWAILDGARSERIYRAVIEFQPDNCCLYSGALAPELQLAAPYLVRLDKDGRLTRYLINHGWGQSWGVFLRSGAGLEELRKHFRRFLIVRGPRGERLVFRYYDPRVLRTYLPTCVSLELETVFGPVAEYIAESDDPGTLLAFRYTQGKLLADSVSLTKQASSRFAVV